MFTLFKIKKGTFSFLLAFLFLIPAASYAQSLSVAQMQAEISSLLQEVASLQAQIQVQNTSTTSSSGSGGTSSGCPVFTRNLGQGTSGSDVSNLQTELNKLGSSVSVTGYFDTNTASAVSQFQSKYSSDILAPLGISNPTGYAGAKTLAKINTLECTTTIAPTPITPTTPTTINCPNNADCAIPVIPIQPITPINPPPAPTSTSPIIIDPAPLPPPLPPVTPPSTVSINIASVSPTSGPVGTQVTITGSGFTATNNTVNFAGSSFTSVVPNITSSGSSLTFLVPSFYTPACSFNTPRCPHVTLATTPGVYQVSVTNTNGTSNTMSFIVTGSSTINCPNNADCMRPMIPASASQ